MTYCRDRSHSRQKKLRATKPSEDDQVLFAGVFCQLRLSLDVMAGGAFKGQQGSWLILVKEDQAICMLVSPMVLKL